MNIATGESIETSPHSLSQKRESSMQKIESKRLISMKQYTSLIQRRLNSVSHFFLGLISLTNKPQSNSILALNFMAIFLLFSPFLKEKRLMSFFLIKSIMRRVRIIFLIVATWTLEDSFISMKQVHSL